MQLRTLKRMLCMFLVNKIFAATDAYAIKRLLLRTAGYSIGEGTKVVAPLYCSAELSVGRNCWIGKNFMCNGNGNVEIGDNCDIGPEVTFQTGGHSIGIATRRAGKGLKFRQTVGAGTWIGGRVTVIGETSIGNSCVIAGCACVIEDVPDNTMVGGVPAKAIKVLTDD